MTILCDTDLETLMRDGLIKDPDFSLLNPASIDIRVGRTAKIEIGYNHWQDVDLTGQGVRLTPGDFALVETFETFRVPNGYAMDLRLKSSTARRGWDHSLAFWVDPNWSGVLTMEVRNVLQYNELPLKCGDRFAQVIVHKLSGLSRKPYAGKYQDAATVEGDKS